MLRPLKMVAGAAVALADRRQCRWERTIFMLGHMRCGSTALANVICSHPAVSGYGEAHIRYGSRGALGELVLNQARRGCWRRSADRLFDKLLHSRHDEGADPGFFTARAIFVAREPAASIRSIRTIAARLRLAEYDTDEKAAIYYRRRLDRLVELWIRFPAEARARVLHAEMTRAPDAALAGISALLKLGSPLKNRYRANPAAAARGAGDPLAAARFGRIVAAEQATSVAPRPLELADAATDALERGWAAFLRATGGDPSGTDQAGA